MGSSRRTRKFNKRRTNTKELTNIFWILKKLDKEQKFTKPPVRFTDSTLVKAIEENESEVSAV